MIIIKMMAVEPMQSPIYYPITKPSYSSPGLEKALFVYQMEATIVLRKWCFILIKTAKEKNLKHFTSLKHFLYVFTFFFLNNSQ